MNQTDLKFYLKEQDIEELMPMGSIRGCKQILEPLNAPLYRRSLEGELVLVKEGIDKYRSTLICEDILCPSFEQITPGTFLWVECIQRFTTPLLSSGKEFKLKRRGVSGSFFLMTPGSSPFTLDVSDTKVVQLTENQHGYVSYRPILHMMLTELKTEMDEWENKVKWKMVLEEV